MPNSPKPEGRLAALFVLGFLLLNFPLLAIFDQGGWVGDIPAAFVYVFAAWAVLIVLLARSVDRRS